MGFCGWGMNGDSPGLNPLVSRCRFWGSAECHGFLRWGTLFCGMPYIMQAGQSVLVGGLARVDILSTPSQTLYLTVWASAYLTCHLGKTENADAILDRHLGSTLQVCAAHSECPFLLDALLAGCCCIG